MKAFRLISVFFALLFLIVSVSGQARLTTSGAATPNTVAPLAGNNFAVVDSGAFSDEKTGILRVVAAMKGVEAKYDPIKKEIQGIRDKITSVQNEITQKGSSLSAAQLGQLQDQNDQLQLQYKRKAEDAQKNYERDLSGALDPLQADIGTALNAYATAKGILMIIDVSRVPVIYSHDSIDITKDFIAEYNRTHPAGGAPAAPKP